MTEIAAINTARNPTGGDDHGEKSEPEKGEPYESCREDSQRHDDPDRWRRGRPSDHPGARRGNTSDHIGIRRGNTSDHANLRRRASDALFWRARPQQSARRKSEQPHRRAIPEHRRSRWPGGAAGGGSREVRAQAPQEAAVNGPGDRGNPAGMILVAGGELDFNLDALLRRLLRRRVTFARALLGAERIPRLAIDLDKDRLVLD